MNPVDGKPLHEYIAFTGDYIWSDEFAPYFNRSFPHSSFNVQDLDSHDNATQRDLRREVKDSNFTLLLGHLIGVDHGGHSGGANNKQIERKLRETETLIEDIIDTMDNDTVIMVYGDHGMNNEGHHGGNSL
jgi:phosphatidylinositol glycan class O